MATKVEVNSVRAHNFSMTKRQPTRRQYIDAQSNRVQKRRRIQKHDFLRQVTFEHADTIIKQQVLLLHAPKQKYVLTDDYAIPELKNEEELLIKVQYIGLNPIDWKAP
jgi:hypothetical protein